MGRGWAEEKQIGEELQREGQRTERWRPGRERVGRQRAKGGQSEKGSWLGKQGLECRRHLGKEEVLKVGGKKERKNGDALEAWVRPPERRGPGNRRRRKEANKSSLKRLGTSRRLGPGGESGSF